MFRKNNYLCPNPRILVIVIVLIIAVYSVFFRPGSNNGPVYNGRHLRAWVLGVKNPKDLDELDKIIANLGTNAIPPLVQMIKEQDSPIRREFLKLLKRQRWMGINALDSREVNCAATKALSGQFSRRSGTPEAIVAILFADLRDSGSDSKKKINAMIALSGFDDDPDMQYIIPRIIELQSDSNIAVRSYATNTLKAFRCLGKNY